MSNNFASNDCHSNALRQDIYGQVGKIARDLSLIKVEDDIGMRGM